MVTARPRPFALQELLILLDAVQMVRLWTRPAVAHNQVASILAHEAHVLLLLFALSILRFVGLWFLELLALGAHGALRVVVLVMAPFSTRLLQHPSQG